MDELTVGDMYRAKEFAKVYADFLLAEGDKAWMLPDKGDLSNGMASMIANAVKAGFDAATKQVAQ